VITSTKLLNKFKASVGFKRVSWSCDPGAMDGLTDKASVFIPAKLLSLMAGIESGIAQPLCTIETVSIERGARELAR
jgi:hypothetical protein